MDVPKDLYASMVIIEALWQKLRQTHALRVLK